MSFSNICGRLLEISWQNIFSRCWSEVILPPSSVSAETHPGVLGLVMGSQGKTHMIISEGVQWRGTKMNNILEHLTWAEGGRDSSAWRRPGSAPSYQLWFNLINRGIEKLKARLFSVAFRGEKKGNGHKLKFRKIQLGKRITLLTVGVIEDWNGLPREGVESPCFEIFRTKLATALRSQL